MNSSPLEFFDSFGLQSFPGFTIHPQHLPGSDGTFPPNVPYFPPTIMERYVEGVGNRFKMGVGQAGIGDWLLLIPVSHILLPDMATDRLIDNCAVECITTYSIINHLGYASAAIPFMMGYPKKWFPPYRVVGTGITGKLTTPLRLLASAIYGRGFNPNKAIFRNIGRVFSRVATPLVIADGTTNIIAIVYCYTK